MTNSLLKKDSGDEVVIINDNIVNTRSSVRNMNKIDIIRRLDVGEINPKLTDSNIKFVLRLADGTIPLLPFTFLYDKINIVTPSELVVNMDNCVHEWSFIECVQLRSADEAPTSIFICTKCNIRTRK